MESVVLLIGSNDREAARLVDDAIAIIARSVGEVVKCSKEYISEPYGFTSANCFVNRAIEIESNYDAYEILRRINLIEALLGRDRDEERKVQSEMGESYASRPIDIDIVLYGNATYDDSRLVIPYHFIDEREYALRPVAEIAAHRRHPKWQYTPEEMLQRLTSKIAK
jgi:2-amino-4-hydroxy-6-hydroxymethyldihydropteridine diphosphokinase